MLHIPDIGVAPALHLLLGLAHSLTEAVIDFLMDAVFILEPDEVGSAVDDGVQKVTGLPGIGPFLYPCLEPPEAESQLTAGHGQDPEVGGRVKTGLQGGDLLPLCQEDQNRFLSGGQQRHCLRSVQIPQVGQNYVRLSGQSRVRCGAF